MDIEHDLFAQFARIGELLHRHQHWTRRAHGPAGDPHRGQGRVMALLKMQPEITQKDLSFLLDIRPQSLGELLAKLERGGYITRTPSDTDRRGMDIRLTEAGTQAAEQSATSADMFASLDRDEQATLGGLLERVIADLEQSLEAMQAEAPDRPGPHGHACFHGRDPEEVEHRGGRHHHFHHSGHGYGEHPHGGEERPQHPHGRGHRPHTHEGRHRPHGHGADDAGRLPGDCGRPRTEHPETPEE